MHVCVCEPGLRWLCSPTIRAVKRRAAFAETAERFPQYFFDFGMVFNEFWEVFNHKIVNTLVSQKGYIDFV